MDFKTMVPGTGGVVGMPADALLVLLTGDSVPVGLDAPLAALLTAALKDGDLNFYTMVYQDKESGKAFAKKFQIGGLSRDKLYPLVKSEGSHVVYLEVSAKEKDMPKRIHVSLDGRSGARVREIDFDLTAVPVSGRNAKGLTITKWAIKDVKRTDLALG